MKLRLNELKGRLADDRRGVSWDVVAEETGIGKKALLALASGETNRLYPVYIDILCEYFGVDPSGLIVAEPITLPHKLNLRPDMHGKSPNPKVKNGATQ